ncbi:excisionase family DNA-binding protein [Streptomyces lycii]|uniref:excisionase family DNA-binding protein n=1 Tax=Streptomyces lycii TaxID=2654337 RepID=UPI001F37CC0C|nr:excisionase family DNA-binding protein [Streptomyces lycii]
MGDRPESGELAYDPTVVLLTVEEAARRLSVGRTVCFRLIRSGELESITVGGLRRVPADAVPEFVNSRRRQPHRPAHTVAV